MTSRRTLLISLLSLLALASLIMIRHSDVPKSIYAWSSYGSLPAWIDKALWGPVQGLGSDFGVLAIFSIYYDAKKMGAKADAWNTLEHTLFRAQTLDPQFLDIYHMGIVILAYDANMPKEAVRLSDLGSSAKPDSWQIPFTGGFIAYDVLHDDRLAAKLMKRAAHVSSAPPLVITLAGKFIAKASGAEDSIMFLTNMMRLLPEAYRSGIEKRIAEIRRGKM